jgi:prophage regulatory protein
MLALGENQCPVELARNRVMRTAAAAAFLGVSVAHFRRLYQREAALRPIRLGERRLGWRLGDLIAWIEAGGTQTHKHHNRGVVGIVAGENAAESGHNGLALQLPRLPGAR